MPRKDRDREPIREVSITGRAERDNTPGWQALWQMIRDRIAAKDAAKDAENDEAAA